MGKIIGRKKEIDELMDIYRCNESQLVAVYGRRRVGKTFLIRELFKDEFAFYHTGLSPSELLDTNLLNAQLEAFSSSLKRYGYNSANTLKNWMDAFDCLADLLSKADKGSRLVVFIDEMPWLDTPRSGFITAFEHFWNGWGAGQDNLMLIVCGSATSWIQDNLINSYGGLYDRVNAEISLSPFTLHETEQFLQAHEITLTRYDILQLYMAIGGIPMYLSYVQRGLSLAQIIDSLYYSRKAKLKREFDRLFNSIFRQPDNYKKVVLLLSKRQCGYSRNEISEELGIGSGNNLSMILSALEESDFIEYYKPFENNKRNMLYRLIDPFCLFYLSQVEGRRRKENFWSDNENSQSLVVWRGRAFENACLNHIPQIKKALGIAGVASENSPWTMRGTEDHDGMQIDLIISRLDRVINLCEMKFVDSEFVVKKDYEAKLRGRLNNVKEKVNSQCNIQITLVTTYGLKYGVHSGIFQRTVVLDDLFEQ
ncbi:MAG: ATP-binding protein [Bacteroidales bacterium]|nr:ATP-binding protein [Bacteroidales bacterium]